MYKDISTMSKSLRAIMLNVLHYIIEVCNIDFILIPVFSVIIVSGGVIDWY